MKRLAGWIAVIFLGIALGAGSALFLILNVGSVRAVKVGAWQTLPLTGTSNADAYTRAGIALSGLLALGPSEAIYFTAEQDDDGKPLSSSCDYAITGADFDSTWWSVTAYGPDRFLISNPVGRFSFNGGSVNREVDNSWVIRAAPMEKPGNWLPTPAGNGRFFLALRLYQPGPGIIDDLSRVTVPKILRETCR